MATVDERIAKLEAKLKQEKAKKQQAEARKRAADLKQKRSDDTRRKILVGALVLEMMERDEATRQHFTQRLESYLTRPDDRALFGLEVRKPLPETPEMAAVRQHIQQRARDEGVGEVTFTAEHVVDTKTGAARLETTLRRVPGTGPQSSGPTQQPRDK